MPNGHQGIIQHREEPKEWINEKPESDNHRFEPPQDFDEYACVIDEEKILVLPFSNHGDGPGRARNWCWDHSMENGFKRHWVFDDNIRDFRRLHRQRRHPIGDGGMFRIIEDMLCLLQRR